jgi:O-antigen ligase
MRLLLIWAAVLVPYTLFGFFLPGEKYISPGNFVAFLISGVVLVHLFAYQTRIPAGLVGWQKPFALFLLSACVSTALSPYFSRAIARGAFQVLALTTMLCLTLALSYQVRREPGFYQILVRRILWGLSGVAILGIVQFFTFNVLRTDLGFAQLLAINDYVGGAVYKLPTELGSVFRPNSICKEPAHLGQFLGMAAGVSFIRIGILGGEMKRRIAPVVPLWAALSILACMVLTLSIISYSLMGIVLLSLAILPRRPSLRLVKSLAASLVVLAALLGLAVKLAGPTFSTKLGTVKLFFTSSQAVADEQVVTEAISAMAITSNIYVMAENLKERPVLGVGLGAHPESYLVHVPDYMRKPDRFRLNAVDAGGLLFRLLSETGCLGTAFFAAGVGLIVLRARKRILDHEPGAAEAKPLAVGITASLIGVICVFAVRWANYYDLEMWLLLALSASVPTLFGSLPRNGPRPVTAGAGT